VEELNEAEKEMIKYGSEENENKGRESFHAVGLDPGNRNPSGTCILPMSTKSVWHGE
jgi:hypothetical protein